MQFQIPQEHGQIWDFENEGGGGVVHYHQGSRFTMKKHGKEEKFMEIFFFKGKFSL